MTIVVGYDGSETARAAVDEATRLAGPSGNVHVVHSCAPPATWLGFPSYQRVLDDHRARGEAIIDDLLMTDDTLLKTSFETELVEASPADALMAAADRHTADLIVVGSRGLGRLRATLGSVSHDVLHRADRPVLVVPAKATGH